MMQAPGASAGSAAEARVALAHEELAGIRADLGSRTTSFLDSYKVCRKVRDTLSGYQKVHMAHRQIRKEKQQLQQRLQEHLIARQHLVRSFGVALHRAAISLRAARLMRDERDLRAGADDSLWRRVGARATQ